MFKSVNQHPDFKIVNAENVKLSICYFRRYAPENPYSNVTFLFNILIF